MSKSTAAVLPAYCFSNVIEPCSAKPLVFDRHYLLYCAQGSIRIEVDNLAWVLPPSRALWIPANTKITVDIKQRVQCCSLLFDTASFASPFEQCQVLTLPTLLKDMILHSKIWGPDRSVADELAQHFFAAIVQMCGQLKEQPFALWVPRGQSERVRKALDYTQQHLSEPVTLVQIAAQVGSTERSLSRLFMRETNMRWSHIQRQMRMIKAIELLSNSQDKVLTVSLSVGYQSLSSFNRAFKEFTGFTPKVFQAQFYEN